MRSINENAGLNRLARVFPHQFNELMESWLESAGVTLLALVGAGLGWWFSRLPKPWWASGYVIGLLLVCAIGAARRFASLEFLPPFAWLLAGRTEFALGGFVAALLLTTPLSRLPRRRERLALVMLLAVFVALTSVWPFLAPAFNRRLQASFKANIDADGICRQSTEYNCGPAAAVTALRHFGLPALEGEIAILAHTSTAIGTPPDLLSDALQRRFAQDGLTSDYRHFSSVSELNQDGIMLAVIKFGFLVDHYVAVLEATEAAIVVGDPFRGRMTYTPEEFAEIWRFTGVVLRRASKSMANTAR